jgi:membrane fusion protein, heavy metal efflux system
MNQAKLLLTCFLLSMAACQSPQEHSHDEEAIPSEAFTRYTDKIEVFVDFEPLVQNRMSTIMAHITLLEDRFIPLLEGEVNLILTVNGKKYTASSTAPDSPGIFELDLTPDSEGIGQLSLDIKTSGFTERVNFEGIKVYPNLTTAVRTLSKTGKGDEISYLKNQAWRIEFANAPRKKKISGKYSKPVEKSLPLPVMRPFLLPNPAGLYFL